MLALSSINPFDSREAKAEGFWNTEVARDPDSRATPGERKKQMSQRN